MANLDLTLNRFIVPNMPSFENLFVIKKQDAGRGCTTEELTTNMMLPFLRMRPIEITSNTGTSIVEADAVIDLKGNVTALTLGSGSYRGVELKITNDADDEVKLLFGVKTLTVNLGETLVLRWNGQNWRVTHDKLVGDFIQQLPSERLPEDKWLDGEWVDWSSRAVIYGISASPPPLYVNYYTLVGTNIAANATPVVMYHVPGGDYQLFRFKAQTTVYTVPNELNPVNWNHIKPSVYDERESCQKLSYKNTENKIVVTEDLQIGDQIISGIHAGKYITEVIVLGGKFLSVEGGFRPSFITGGVAGDMIRNILGGINFNGGTINSASGAFVKTGNGNQVQVVGIQNGYFYITFDSSQVVPTGPEVSPRTFSVKFWRRVA